MSMRPLSDREAIAFLHRLNELVQKYRDVPVPAVRLASMDEALALYDILFPAPFGNSGAERTVVASLWCELADKITADHDAPREIRAIADRLAPGQHDA